MDIRSLVVLSLFASALSQAAETTPAAAAPAPTGKLELPECVIQDPVTGVFYCSNVGGSEATAENVTAKDKNGFISTLNPDGSVLELRFFPAGAEAPLNGPKGMAIAQHTLWVADIDRVVGIDLATKKQTKVIDLKPFGAGFANDLVSLGDAGPLLCSDTTSDQIFAISIVGSAEKPVWIIGKGQFGGANGLAISGSVPDRKLIIAGFPINDQEAATGKVWSCALDEALTLGAPEELPFPAGLWDGCAVHDGMIIVSDWVTGSLQSCKDGSKPIGLAEDLKGPADFCVLQDGTGILVPEMQANKVTKIDF